MDPARPELTVLVPAFNEEARLGQMLEAYLPVLRERFRDRVEVIVLVNGSCDRTASVASAYRDRYPFLRVTVEPRAVGKGGALIQGFAMARGEAVGFVDADGATPPDAFLDLFERRSDADVILASRWLPGSRITPQPLSRRLASRVFHLLVRLFFRLRLSDTQCGAKILRRAVVETILPRLGTTNWAFDVDLLFQARRAGCRIVEVPTVWNDRAGSRLRVARASWDMFRALVRLRLLYSGLCGVVTLHDRIFSLRSGSASRERTKPCRPHE